MEYPAKISSSGRQAFCANLAAPKHRQRNQPRWGTVDWFESLRTCATEDNPDVRRVERELAELQAQSAKMSQMERSGAEPGKGNLQVPKHRVPEGILEHLRVADELKYHESLYDSLGKQLEAARIDESKNAVTVRVVDKAVEPEHKSSPKRPLIVAVTAVASFLLSCLGVLIWEVVPPEAARPCRTRAVATIFTEF